VLLPATLTVPVKVGQCFTILARPQGSLAAGKIANVLKFKVKEIDPSSGEAEEDGYEDEYQVGTC
jgi:coatomer protein complex subunit gamma